jgi:hypothetical protein
MISRFLTSACALRRWLSASISGGSASEVFSSSSDTTALPIALAAAVMLSSSGSVSPTFSSGVVGGGGWGPRPRCGWRRRGSRMFDSRKVLDVCSTRVFSSASAFDTDLMSVSDLAPLALRPRRSSFQVATTISFWAVTRSSIEPWLPPGMPPWLCARENSCSYGFTSRKKMSLRDSFGRVPRVTSRART